MLNHYKENKSRWKLSPRQEKKKNTNHHQTEFLQIINIFKVKCKTVTTNTKNCNKTGNDTETQC